VLRQVHRLGGGDVVNRDRMVGDELHPTVIAECAEIGALFGESANVSIEAAAAAS